MRPRALLGPTPRDGALRAWHVAITVAATCVGHLSRLQHLRTFEPDGRQSDFDNTLRAVEAVRDCHCALSAGDDLHNGYHGPLFYSLAAKALERWPDDGPKHIAWISLVAWLARQLVLCAGMRAVAPRAPWAMVLAAALHAALPVAAYQDAIAYNESLHATLFAVAFFALWRLEVKGPRDVSPRDALVVGVFAGLGLLTKATSAIVPMVAAALGLAWVLRARVGERLDALRRLALPAAMAAAGWTLTAGWWCARNLIAYRLPFPHQYDVRFDAVAASHPAVREPLSYQRPLGWYLPFETRVLYDPIGPWDPNNFWSETLAGTWADDINHGFCRLAERSASTTVYEHPMSDVCVELAASLTRVGAGLTLVTALGCASLAWRDARSGGRRGSLVLPVTVGLTLALLMMFGARYPFDHHPVVKAAYALPIAAPLCAAFGLFVAGEAPAKTPRAALARAVGVSVALGVIGWVLLTVRREVYGP